MSLHFTANWQEVGREIGLYERRDLIAWTEIETIDLTDDEAVDAFLAAERAKREAREVAGAAPSQ